MRAEEHPEALIDRAMSGALDPEAQATLDQHLASCPACAEQVSLAPRFARELAPQPRDEVLDLRALEAAMRRMQSSPPVARRRPLPSWFRWAAAAALLLFGVTGAAAVIGRWIAPRPVIRAAGADCPTARGARADSSRRGRAAGSASAARTAAREGGASERVVPPRRRSRRRRCSNGVRSCAGRDAPTPRSRPIVDCRRRFRRRREARLSFAFAGQLLLGQKRPDDALAQFDRHLKAGGEVGEEALAGRATALEELHRTADAVAAWKSLLARYPGSVYAGRARARLDELMKSR